MGVNMLIYTHIAIAFGENLLGTSYATLGYAIAVLLLVSSVSLFPQIVSAVLRFRPLADLELKSRIDAAFLEAGLSPGRVLVWKPKRKIANAAIIGWFPGNQNLILTDVMIELFPHDELMAIVRHEIGHIKQKHPLKRLGLAFLPLAFLILDFVCHWGLYHSLAACAVPGAEFLILIGYVTYLQWLTSSQFPKMEFEADLFSIQNPQGQSMTPRVQSMCGGLRRFAAIYPAELTRKGGPHPSLFDRITRLERQDLDSASAS